jgi:hypothetical protein
LGLYTSPSTRETLEASPRTSPTEVVSTEVKEGRDLSARWVRALYALAPPRRENSPRRTVSRANVRCTHGTQVI